MRKQPHIEVSSTESRLSAAIPDPVTEKRGRFASRFFRLFRGSGKTKKEEMRALIEKGKPDITLQDLCRVLRPHDASKRETILHPGYDTLMKYISAEPVVGKFIGKTDTDFPHNNPNIFLPIFGVTFSSPSGTETLWFAHRKRFDQNELFVIFGDYNDPNATVLRQHHGDHSFRLVNNTWGGTGRFIMQSAEPGESLLKWQAQVGGAQKNVNYEELRDPRSGKYAEENDCAVFESYKHDEHGRRASEVAKFLKDVDLGFYFFTKDVLKTSMTAPNWFVLRCQKLPEGMKAEFVPARNTAEIVPLATLNK